MCCSPWGHKDQTWLKDWTTTTNRACSLNYYTLVLLFIIENWLVVIKPHLHYWQWRNGFLMTKYCMVFLPVLQSILSLHYCCCCCVAKPCLTLSNPIDCSPADPSAHEISQARVLEWVAITFSRRSSQHRDWTHTSCTASKFFTTEPPEKPVLSLIKGLLNRFAKYLLRTYVKKRQQGIHFWKNVFVFWF